MKPTTVSEMSNEETKVECEPHLKTDGATSQSQESFDSSALVSEAKQTASQIKDTVKNMKFKEETKRTKGFFSNMLKKPISTIQSVAASGMDYLNIAIAVIAVWVAASLVKSIFITFFVYHYGWNFGLDDFLGGLLSIVFSVVTPIFIVIVLSAIFYMFFKKKVDKFLPLAITVTIAGAPYALSEVFGVLGALMPGAYSVIGKVDSLLSLVAVLLTYFALKTFSGEEDEKFFKKFVLIQGCFFGSRFIFNAFGIDL